MPALLGDEALALEPADEELLEERLLLHECGEPRRRLSLGTLRLRVPVGRGHALPQNSRSQSPERGCIQAHWRQRLRFRLDELLPAASFEDQHPVVRPVFHY
jgi:hypothetical protein